MGIVQKINMVPLYIAMGLSQGIMPLVSYNFASGNIRRMKDTITFSMKITLSFMAMTSVIYSLGAGTLTSLFMENETIIAYGTRFLRGLCLALPFLCVDFLAVGVFQACGMGKNALVFSILRKIVLEIPALFLWNHFYPLYRLAYAQVTAEVILAGVAVVVLVRLFKKLERKQR